MNTVELFSGTGSFSKVAKKQGHSIFRVELDKKFDAELHKDILELQRKDLPGKIDVLWASPPCTTFSIAAVYRYWVDGKPKNAKTWHGISMVIKTLQLIEEIKQDNPDLIWFIENPRGILRKQWFMKGIPRKTITYCQYGLDVMKPTDIWTNVKFWETKPMCSPGDSCHEEARRSGKGGIQNPKLKGTGLTKAQARAIIPPLFFEEIFTVLKRGYVI